MLDINAQLSPELHGIEPALLSSERLKQSALIIQTRIHFMNQNNGKYAYRRLNGIVTREKVMNEM